MTFTDISRAMALAHEIEKELRVTHPPSSLSPSIGKQTPFLWS